MNQQQLDPALVARLMQMEDPENDPEMIQMARQRKMIDGLRGQAQQGMQGQMVSGHYVAPSALAQVANIGTGMMGAMQDRQMDNQTKAMGVKRGGARKEYFDALMARMRGGATPGLDMGMPIDPNGYSDQ